MSGDFSFLEFFSGGGMTRLGLGDGWRCLFANDFDSQKCAAYRANFGGDELIECDIADLSLSDMPKDRADLMWGSFPCQDLSLAGARGGIKAARSSAFFAFWNLAVALAKAGRPPRIVAVENVAGLLTSNDGRDFKTVAEMMARAGYLVSAAIIDAKDFTPQSRPRLFIVAFLPETAPATQRRKDEAPPGPIVAAYERLSSNARAQWIWLPDVKTPRRNVRLSDVIDWNAETWHNVGQTRALIRMMSATQRTRFDALLKSGAKRAGAGFRRTRIENGETVQRFEARFDGLAGCLRTPAGGSSRQIILAVENGTARTRLMSPREAARLMGMPDDYLLPESATAALKLCGDGVCVPAVQWLAENIFEPSLRAGRARKAA